MNIDTIYKTAVNGSNLILHAFNGNKKQSLHMEYVCSDASTSVCSWCCVNLYAKSFASNILTLSSFCLSLDSIRFLNALQIVRLLIYQKCIILPWYRVVLYFLVRCFLPSMLKPISYTSTLESVRADCNVLLLTLTISHLSLITNQLLKFSDLTWSLIMF